MHPLLVKNAAPLSDAAKGRLRTYGENVVDERTIGDYEFFLTQNSFFKENVQLGMQRVGHDMTLIEEQQTKFPQEKGKFSMSELRLLLNEWIYEYKRILIGTFEPRKKAFYAKLIRALGFKLSETTVMGHPVLVLDAPSDSE